MNLCYDGSLAYPARRRGRQVRASLRILPVLQKRSPGPGLGFAVWAGLAQHEMVDAKRRTHCVKSLTRVTLHSHLRSFYTGLCSPCRTQGQRGPEHQQEHHHPTGRARNLLLMGHLNGRAWRIHGLSGVPSTLNPKLYRSTSLISKRPPPGPHSKPVPRARGWSFGGGVLMSEVTL